MSYSIGNGSKVILSGGGDEKQSLLLDNFFLQNIKINGTLLYIPIALRGHRLFSGAEIWFKSVFSLHKREDVNILTLKDLSNSVNLNNFDAIYIGGGNTWSLLKELIEFRFIEKIKSYIKLENKIIYGGSAGAIILGENISCQNDEVITSFSVESGLSLIDKYSVTCHYEGDNEQETLIRNWVSKNQGRKLLALSENGGIVFFNDGKQKIFGTGHFLFDDLEKTELL